MENGGDVRSVDVTEERVAHDEVEALEAARVEGEVLVRVDARGDVRHLAFDGHLRNDGPGEVERVHREFLAAANIVNGSTLLAPTAMASAA